MRRSTRQSIAERYMRLVGRDVVREVDEELAYHVDRRTNELIASGTDPVRAREEALRRFGDPGIPRVECITIGRRRERAMMRSEYVAELWQELSRALRALRRNPGFTAVAVLTLALGIGANSAIFSVVHGVLFASLPYERPDDLVRIRTAYPNGKLYSISSPDFASIRQEAAGLQEVAGSSVQRLTLTGVGEPKDLRGSSVTDGFFRLLGVPPALGRTFHPDEHQPGRGRVAVLGHAFWQRELAADAGVLGRAITLGGESYTVVGVMPQRFRYPERADVYIPIAHDASFSATAAEGRRSEWLSVIARTNESVTPRDADATLRSLGTRLQESFPATNARVTFSATPLRDVLFGDVRTPLLVLLAAVGLVLLIACANVANLLLSRAAARSSEFAVRAALGAGRGRILRQLLTESLVLGLLGGAAGLLLAYWATRALVAARPEGIPRVEEVGIGGLAIAFTAGVSILTAALFGIAPAVHATRASVVQALREGGRGSLGARSGHRLRSALVITETALAVVLLVGAGLLIRSFVNLAQVDPGFRPDQAVAVQVALQGARYEEPAARRNFFRALTERFEALPGVTVAGGASGLPLKGGAEMIGLTIEGRDPGTDGDVREIRLHTVTPGYFEAIGASLERGRMLTAEDHEDAVPVTLINAAAAERWFPDEDPLGQRILFGRPRMIVGVVADVKQVGLGESTQPEMYLPHAQDPYPTLHMVVRASGDPMTLAGALRREVQALDPTIPVEGLTRLDQIVSESVARPRFYTSLLTIFAAAALALASIGIFGVMSYGVAQRTREIGIRIALGARPAQVVGMVVARGLRLAGAGVLIGTAAAIALTRVLSSQLYGVSATDPATFVAMLLFLGGTAALASWLPARRASRVAPVVALRE